ncbi:MAG: thioredoxin domain-containing protein [Bdellovibrionales bacterium]|jgi:protein-disulfide isomerase/uncharacterized membrane protein|nr:thioredoxin domain-containing protein [Bdellovibrionales bacterium]MBT3525462.1 thioredoxin domain-containing protein [Bdellovibrionales bacterium]MBT7768105.1 thioredoxin domain-containing protein [Bdellovibrionales bacterium]
MKKNKYSFGLLLLAAIGMIASSLYLTGHFFDTHYPTGLGASYLCNFSSFFSCDAASYSPLSNIGGVPISFMGIIIGLLFIVHLFTKLSLTKITHYIAHLNSFGCVTLLIYSVAILGHLCPVCFIYYLFSFLASYALLRGWERPAFEIRPFAIWSAIFLIATGAMKLYINHRAKRIKLLAPALIKEYDSNRNLGYPDPASPYRILSASEKFTAAPIRITIFSDFQCPACAMLSKVLHTLAPKYQGKINVQYFFYPLDDSCNPAMERPLHLLACKAAYLASCLPDSFPLVHDQIFEIGHSLSNQWLNDYAKSKGVTDCYNSEQTKQQVAKMIEQATPFKIRSTPTILLNGVKIEGVLPLAQLFILLDELLRRGQAPAANN